ncbi:MAG: hypothetical protein ACYDA4_17400 [Ignavibacteriaceae bacterium]
MPTLQQIIIPIIFGIITALIETIANIVWERIKFFEKELEAVSNESMKIKGNHLSRFEEVYENIHDTKDSILIGNAEIKLMMEKGYVRKVGKRQ